MQALPTFGRGSIRRCSRHAGAVLSHQHTHMSNKANLAPEGKVGGAESSIWRLPRALGLHSRSVQRRILFGTNNVGSLFGRRTHFQVVAHLLAKLVTVHFNVALTPSMSVPNRYTRTVSCKPPHTHRAPPHSKQCKVVATGNSSFCVASCVGRTSMLHPLLTLSVQGGDASSHALAIYIIRSYRAKARTATAAKTPRRRNAMGLFRREEAWATLKLEGRT